MVALRFAFGEYLLKASAWKPRWYVTQNWESFHRKSARCGPPDGLQGSMRNRDAWVIFVYDIDTVDDFEDCPGE